MTDRGWWASCGVGTRDDPRCAGKGLHPPDAQRLRGARRAGGARPARRRRRDRAAADRRHRRLLRRRHLARARRAARPQAARRWRARAVDEPARQADADRRHDRQGHLVGPRGLAAAQRQHARLRRRRALPRRWAPLRHPEAGLERRALPRWPGGGHVLASGNGPLGRHHGLEGAHGHRRPVRRQPRRRGDGLRAHRQPLGVLHRRQRSRPRPRCWPMASTTTCSRSPSRSATTTRSAPSTRARRSRCSTSTRATARARARRRRRTRAALAAAENALARPLRQGRRAAAGGRRRHPHLEVPGHQRRDALPRAVVGAAGPG